MSLYADYVHERLPNGHVIENEHGFIYFHIFEELQQCIIEDIYIRPKSRGLDKGLDLEQQIIDNYNITHIIGIVNVSVPCGTYSVKRMIDSGYTVKDADNNIIRFIKEI